MRDVDLMAAALENTEAVLEGLKAIARVGKQQPVPPEMLTIVLSRMRPALSAVTELERRARAGEGGK